MMRITPTVMQIAGGLAVIIATLAIEDWWDSGKQAQLVASVASGPVHYPPVLSIELAETEDALESDVHLLKQRLESAQNDDWENFFLQIFNESDLSIEAPERLARLLTAEVVYRLPRSYTLFEEMKIIDTHPEFFRTTEHLRRLKNSSPDYQGYWHVKVVNEGGRAAESVTLRLPRASYALISRSNEPPRTTEIDEEVELGNLLPYKEVDVLAWTPSEPSAYASKSVSLVYSEGTGKVREIDQAPLNEEVAPIAFLVLFIATFLTLILSLILKAAGVEGVALIRSPKTKVVQAEHQDS